MKIKKSEFKQLILEEVTDFYNQAGQRMINMAEYQETGIPQVDRTLDQMERFKVNQIIDTPAEAGPFLVALLQWFLSNDPDDPGPGVLPRDLMVIRDIVYDRLNAIEAEEGGEEEFEEAPPEEFEEAPPEPFEVEDVEPLDV